MDDNETREWGGQNTKGELLRAYRVLETDDLDHAREFVNGVWERHHSEMRRGREYDLLWNESKLIRSSLSYLQTSSRIRIECAPLSDCYRITMHEFGSLAHRINNCETVSTTKQAVIHAPGQELRLDTEPFRTLLLSFDGQFVRDTLVERYGHVPDAQTLRHTFSLQSPAAMAMRSLCRWAARELDRPDRGSLAAPSAAASLEGTLLTLFLECLNDPQPAGKRRGEAAAMARVTRVEDWIDANLSESIRVDDLARVANISVRALENAFRRFRGCSPMEAVTRRRLNRAQHILRSPNPETTVTAVATECGFFHFGRFAGQYRKAFGETPSQTLRLQPTLLVPRSRSPSE